MKFYLGIHRSNWLAQSTVPVFLSMRTLRQRKRWHRASCDWGIDSGGFTELKLYGRWTIAPEQYASEVLRAIEECGRVDFAAIQDWMCEPKILANTGATIREHQQRTIESLHTLSHLAPEVPWLPVIQGWHVEQYVEHVSMYEAAGVDLRSFPVVGVGSVCRRQATDEAGQIFYTLQQFGLNLHGFGVKIDGLRKFARFLYSSDSLAWSLGARYAPPLRGCTHRNCANCLKYALLWRERVEDAINTRLPVQRWLPL